MDNNFGKKIGSGLFTNAYLKDGMVTKVPKRTARIIGQNKTKITYALSAHEEYLGTYLAKTEIISTNISSLGYIMQQEYIANNGSVAFPYKNHMPDYTGELFELISRGLEMQKKHHILFDVFGLYGYLEIINPIPGAMKGENILQGTAGGLKFIDVGYMSTKGVNPVRDILANTINPYFLKRVGFEKSLSS